MSKQEIGETRQAMMEDDERIINQIINDNKNRKEPYWIVHVVKKSSVQVDGKPTLIKHIKPYYKKPRSLIGMNIAEVDNIKGTIKWEVNLPDVPFGFELLGVKEDLQPIVCETSIQSSYVYN